MIANVRTSVKKKAEALLSPFRRRKNVIMNEEEGGDLASALKEEKPKHFGFLTHKSTKLISLSSAKSKIRESASNIPSSSTGGDVKISSTTHHNLTEQFSSKVVIKKAASSLNNTTTPPALTKELSKLATFKKEPSKLNSLSHTGNPGNINQLKDKLTESAKWIILNAITLLLGIILTVLLGSNSFKLSPAIFNYIFISEMIMTFFLLRFQLNLIKVLSS